jgi:hypothetical protein
VTKTQTKQERLTESTPKKGRIKVSPGRDGARKILTSHARVGKLREIVKEMKEVTVVADRIVAVATEQKTKSTAKQKRPAAPSKALKRGLKA